MNILTITPNPAIDRTIGLGRLVPGAVNRAESVHTHPGGKGVNVSSCLSDWGLSSTACGFMGMENTAVFTNLFAAKNIADRFVRIQGMTRTNLKLVGSDGTTDINLPGAAVSGEARDAFRRGLSELSAPDVAVLSGSLPPGVPESFYIDCLRDLARMGSVRTLLDTDGAILREVLSAPERPYCVKPNLAELSQLAGREIADTREAAREAGKLLETGIGLVVVSMGERGALFIRRDGALLARGRVEKLASTVGAGDAMVAGIVAAMAEKAELERLARLATAFSLGKLSRGGPNLPDRETVERLAASVTVELVERRNS